MQPGLGTVLVGDDPASRWYVNAKHKDCAEIGVASIRRDLPADRDAGRGRGRRRRAQRRPGVHGVPRAAADRAGRVRDPAAVDPDKDVDGLHPTNLGWLVLGKPAPLPCTPTGIIELLRRYDVPIAGANVVVVGRGITVGRPLALMLTRRSENATVTVCHTGTRDLAAHVRQADIVVAAAGVAVADHRRHGQAGRGRARRRRQPGRRQDRRRRRAGRRRGGRVPQPQPGRRRADDPRDAAHQRRRGRRARRSPRRRDGAAAARRAWIREQAVRSCSSSPVLLAAFVYLLAEPRHWVRGTLAISLVAMLLAGPAAAGRCPTALRRHARRARPVDRLLVLPRARRAHPRRRHPAART